MKNKSWIIIIVVIVIPSIVFLTKVISYKLDTSTNFIVPYEFCQRKNIYINTNFEKINNNNKLNYYDHFDNLVWYKEELKNIYFDEVTYTFELGEKLVEVELIKSRGDNNFIDQNTKIKKIKRILIKQLGKNYKIYSDRGILRLVWNMDNVNIVFAFAEYNMLNIHKPLSIYDYKYRYSIYYDMDTDSNYIFGKQITKNELNSILNY